VLLPLLADELDPVTAAIPAAVDVVLKEPAVPVVL
jgi:hypothetical protein